ncbi:Serine/threonine-protein kinase TBK1 [Lamellibrachia satsuma]|nr:Serine/threonine-protein kinase TBK1 [Lamellibrachia satsuma]
MPATHQQATTTFFWFLVDILGQGATGCVYKARHKKTGDFYAVKVFNQMSYMRPHSIQMREFDVLRKLNHDNIVRLLAVEEEMSTHCNVLVMELCTGGSLYNVLDEPENAYGIEETEFFCVLHDIADGLKHLRHHGIVHRDIKPGNIMKYIADDGRSIYKLTDFGAARELEDEESFMSLYGTEEYLFPDVYERAVLRRPMGKQFGAAVDLWSLGVTLYHVATGQLPFRPFGGRKNREVMYRITTEKDSGVISGFQSMEGGTIEWCRELPDTCQLSQGSKLLVTPLLAGLMESNPEIMWPFPKFFDATTDVCSRILLHVFSMCTGTMLHVFASSDDCYAKIQERIAEQADIHANNQMLLFDNARLSTIVQPMQHVSTYPKTSMNDPIILFYNSGADVPRLVLTTFPKVSPLVKHTSLESDAQLARNCGAVICAMWRATQDSVHKQRLMHVGIKVVQSVQVEQIRRVQDYSSQFGLLVVETKKRLSNLTMFASLLATICYANGVQTTIKSLHGKLSDLSKTFAECKKRELQSRWKHTLGCQESDKCVDKMRIMQDSVKEIRISFIQHRKLKSLSASEDQIHHYDKRKLCKLYDDGRCLLDRHCLQNEQTVFRKAVRLYELIDGMVGSKVQRVESQIMTATEKLNSIRPHLDMIQTDLETLFSQKSDVVLEKPPPMTQQQNGENKTQSDSVTNGTFSMSKPKPCSDELLTMLQAE